MPNEQDDIYFYGSEIDEKAGQGVPGPQSFESDAVTAPAGSTRQDVDDLPGNSIRFPYRSPVERTLNAYFDDPTRTGSRGFTEDPRNDRCLQTREPPRPGRRDYDRSPRSASTPAHRCSEPHPSRDPVSLPVMVRHGEQRDAQWTSIVAWTVHTLVKRGEGLETRWYAGGAGRCRSWRPNLASTRLAAPLLAARRNYGEIFERRISASVRPEDRSRPQRKQF